MSFEPTPAKTAAPSPSESRDITTEFTYDHWPECFIEVCLDLKIVILFSKLQYPVGPESSLYIMSALAHQVYTLSDRPFREIKHNAVPCNLFFNKRSGAVVMSLDSEGLGAAVVAGMGSNHTQPSGISYFSLFIFF